MVVFEQTTAYPLDSQIEIMISMAAADTFSVALRIPAWAGSTTEAAVNGKRLEQALIPGSFHTISRTWKDGDRISLTLNRPLRLEAVDAQHPQLLAVMQGPLALFAVGDRFLQPTRGELESVRQTAARSSEWRMTTADGVQMFKPYFAIDSGTTRLYQPVPA